MNEKQIEELPELLTTEQAAEVINVHVVTMQRFCKSGKVPCVRVGYQWRIPKKKLLAYCGIDGATNF